MTSNLYTTKADVMKIDSQDFMSYTNKQYFQVLYGNCACQLYFDIDDEVTPIEPFMNEILRVYEDVCDKIYLVKSDQKRKYHVFVENVIYKNI